MVLHETAVPANAGSACVTCGRLLHWHWDVARQQGHLSCHCPHLPHDIVEVVTSEEEVPVTPAPPPPPLASPPPTQEPPTSPLRADRAGLYERGPPNGLVRTDRNSWCYVPLLLGAAGLLHPVAAAQWRADPRSREWWDNACRRLQQAQPVPADAILEALWIAVGDREPLLLQRLRHAARDHPPPALVDLAWCMSHCTQEDGYIPAPAQEVCLQIYGGPTMSSELDRFTNAYRTHAQAAPRGHNVVNFLFVCACKKIESLSPNCKQGGQLVEHVLGANSMLEQPIALLAKWKHSYQISNIVPGTQQTMFSSHDELLKISLAHSNGEGFHATATSNPHHQVAQQWNVVTGETQYPSCTGPVCTLFCAQHRNKQQK